MSLTQASWLRDRDEPPDELQGLDPSNPLTRGVLAVVTPSTPGATMSGLRYRRGELFAEDLSLVFSASFGSTSGGTLLSVHNWEGGQPAWTHVVGLRRYISSTDNDAVFLGNSGAPELTCGIVGNSESWPAATAGALPSQGVSQVVITFPSGLADGALYYDGVYRAPARTLGATRPFATWGNRTLYGKRSALLVWWNRVLRGEEIADLRGQHWKLFPPSLIQVSVPAQYAVGPAVAPLASATSLGTVAGAQTHQGTSSAAQSASAMPAVAATQTHQGTAAALASAGSLGSVAANSGATGSVAPLVSATALGTVAGAQTHQGASAAAQSAGTLGAVAGTQSHQGSVAVLATGSSMTTVAAAGAAPPPPPPPVGRLARWAVPWRRGFFGAVGLPRVLQKEVAELEWLQVDFAPALSAGETLLPGTVALALSVAWGNDATPQTLLDAPFELQGAAVWQRLAGGAPGAIYLLRFSVSTSTGRVLVLPVRIRIRRPV